MINITGSNIEFNGFEFDGNYDGNYIIVDGLEWHSYLGGDGNSTDGYGSERGNRGSIAININNSNNVKLHDCSFNDISWSAIDLYNTENVEIYNNTFINSSQDYIPIHNSTNTHVHDNICYNPQHDAIHAYTNCSDVLIENNKIIMNKQAKSNNPYFIQNSKRPVPSFSGIVIDHIGYFDSEVSNVSVVNNTITSELDDSDYDFGVYGVRGINICGYPKDVIIKNNIVKLSKGICVILDSPNLGNLNIENNTFETTNSWALRYRPDITQNNINYETEKRGVLNILNNNIINHNGIGIEFYDPDLNNALDSFTVNIEGNIYDTTGNALNIDCKKDNNIHFNVK